jgi:hypothetical protein
MDKKDIFAFFQEVKYKYPENDMTSLMSLFENYEISKLDIQRIYRYLDKYTKSNEGADSDASDDEGSIQDD